MASAAVPGRPETAPPGRMAAALTTAVFAVLALGPAPGAADEVGPDTVGPGPSGAAQEAARQAKPSAAAEAPQRIEVTGRRDDPDAARRRATAAKIVIDRQEIEAFGDSSLGEVLRRLPGITTGGTPGRGGAPRMRGLGSGYTRLLIDGEPIPPGFSLEQISPELVERIEILRAPTAETGARAIAGTINIVLREALRQRIDELRIGVDGERGELSPRLAWTRNDARAGLSWNFSGTVFERRTRSPSEITTGTEDEAGAEVVDLWRESRLAQGLRRGVHASARLQWGLGEPGESLTISPSVFHARNENGSRSAWQAIAGIPPNELARSESESRFTAGRLNAQWRERLASGARAELGANLGRWQSRSAGGRDEFDHAEDALPARRIDDMGRSAQTSLALRAKWSLLLGGDEADAPPARDAASWRGGGGSGRETGADEGGDEASAGPTRRGMQPAPPRLRAPAPDAMHELVAGAELELQRRRESRSLLEGGVPLLADFGAELQARRTRAAAYLQDEWSPSRRWSVQAGLRWEGIETAGEADPLLGDAARVRNRHGVWTPLLHAVFRPDPASRNQWRASLTRSWRAPATSDLVGRPRPDTRWPLDGPNEPTAPDRIGNPALRPELASGIDLAWEHYPAGGGVLSVGVFQRRLSELMRSVTRLEDVPWSPVPRWVARTENVRDATTRGLELEAKGRLAELLGHGAGARGEAGRVTAATGSAPAAGDAWPRIDLRASLSLYQSSVAGIPGPDDRLDRQPSASAKLGADWSPRGWPLRLGADLDWVPAYETQVDAGRRVGVSTRRIVDAYLLWTIGPSAALRVSAGNLLPRTSEDFERVDAGAAVATERTLTSSARSWALRLELKL